MFFVPALDCENGSHHHLEETYSFSLGLNIAGNIWSNASTHLEKIYTRNC